jgi:hypothetical protein
MWSDTSVHDTKDTLAYNRVRDEGDSCTSRRPTLQFNSNKAYYQYYDSGASAFKSDTITISSSTIIRSRRNINVFGTVTGRVTVVTDSGKSIHPVGNLVTSDYTGDSVPFSSSNMIGLISGKDIRFNDTWIKHFKGDAADSTQEVARRCTINGTDTAINISAGIIALKTKVIGGTTVKCCEFWDGMWDGTPQTKESYRYKLFGNHILAAYMRTIAVDGSGVWSAGCKPGGLSFSHDPRMYKKLIQPPGFPGVSTKNGLYLLSIGGWQEDNKL